MRRSHCSRPQSGASPGFACALAMTLVLSAAPGCDNAPPPPPARETIQISGGSNKPAAPGSESPATPESDRPVTETLDLNFPAAGSPRPGKGKRSNRERSKPLVMRPTADLATVQIVALRTAAEGATVEPGEVEALVVIDGQFARDEHGQLLKTPCEIQLSKGEHAIRLAAKGYRETAQSHVAEDGRTIEIPLTYEPFAEPEGLIASRLVNATFAEELPLEQFRAAGSMGDPYVTPDQLAIYMSGEGAAGKGIFVARREQTWDEFGPAEFISSTRSTGPTASPSVNGDQTQLAWLITGKTRIWGVRLTGDRVPRDPLKFTDVSSEVWLSAWLSPSGLSLYSLQKHDGKPRTLQVIRLEDDETFEDNWFDIALHNAHPVLSADALRLYTFDGKTLQRALRERDTDPFGPLELLVEIPLANYHYRPDRRQFWVTDDEQWLYYSDDPARDGTIYVTRIADAPAWVEIPVGQRLTNPTVTRPTIPAAEPADPPKTAPSTAPDPRALPLAYESFRNKLLPLLADWKFDDAAALVESASTDRELALDRELIGWDREEVTAAKRFFDELIARLTVLEPGTEIRLSGAMVKFQSFADGVVTAEVRNRETKKPLATLSPVDLIALLEKQHDPDDSEWAWSVAAFLSATPHRVSPAILSSRMEKAGVHGRQYVDRQRRRELALIHHEVARKNFGPALVRIEALVAKAPKSETATQALELRENLSARQAWRTVGGQAWDTSVPGQFSTRDKTSPDAFLTCDEQFTNFQASLEWKTAGPAAQGGVYFGYSGTGPLRDNAFKVHVANDAELAARPDKYSTGALRGQLAPLKNAVRPEGEWNSLVVRVVDRRITVTVNGETVLKEQPLPEPATDAAPATKTKDKPTGGVATGPVLIDGEFPGITYRKLFVYELPSAASAPRK